MENKLAVLYNKLGSKIVSTIPEKWEKIYFLGEVGNGKTSRSSVFYFMEPGADQYTVSYNIPERYKVSEEIYEQLMDEAEKILLEIYDCFVESNQEPWEQLSMSIDNAGKFNIDYSYGTISGSDKGPMEREMIWAYEAFGNLPEEGTYMRKLLDKYIEQKSKG